MALRPPRSRNSLGVKHQPLPFPYTLLTICFSMLFIILPCSCLQEKIPSFSCKIKRNVKTNPRRELVNPRPRNEVNVLSIEILRKLALHGPQPEHRKFPRTTISL